MTSSLRYKLSVEIPTDTAEREQKPSLAWIMPSREEEKPTLCRINQHSPYVRLWHDVGVTPVLLLDISIIFQLSSFIFHLSSFISPLSSFIFHLEFPNLGRNIGGRRAEEEISVKKRRLFDCFKNA